MTHCRAIIAVLLVLGGIQGAALPAENARMRGPVVRQVDHIVVESDHPAELFHFFSRTLQLPEAWLTADDGGFHTGGISAGNVNLAIIPAAGAGKPGRKGTARYAALAFEPYPLQDALRELKVRGIPHAPPEPAAGMLPGGDTGTLWTTVGLDWLSRPGMSLFLYETSPAYLNAGIRRRQLANRLALGRGGPLGVRSVAEVVLAAADAKARAAEWTKLLGRPKSPGLWPTVMAGPSIRLLEGPTDRIRELVLRVNALERARAFLVKEGLRGATADGSLTLDPAGIQGLAIRIVE